ncbi:dephospho-CoA kinase [Corynebacterium epidermidicanis]|nr:dephospho-CoA kinase [Corynebacterium epidermidicanis]
MKKIGLTGGIGSGKSTVAGMLAARGIPVIDADQVARDVVPTALPELRVVFGPDIIAADGSLDRAALARLAFASPAATEKLNAIMHPLIREETERRFAAAQAAGYATVVYDMPLLVDLGLDQGMDEVWVVHVDPEERVRRLIRRGLSEEDARRRMAAQIGDSQRNAAADVLLDNNGTLADLQRQVEALA